MAANMFNKAKESATKGSSKKNDKVIVKVEDPSLIRIFKDLHNSRLKWML